HGAEPPREERAQGARRRGDPVRVPRIRKLLLRVAQAPRDQALERLAHLPASLRPRRPPRRRGSDQGGDRRRELEEEAILRAVKRRRPTIGQAFFLATALVVAVVATTLAVFHRESSRSILEASDHQRVATARRVEARVEHELGRAHHALETLEKSIQAGAIPIDDPVALEAALFVQAIDEHHIEELTFTRAHRTGWDDQGEAIIAPDDRWQLTLYKT